MTLALIANPTSPGEEMVIETLQRPYLLSSQEGALMHWGDERPNRIKWMFIKSLLSIAGDSDAVGLSASWSDP